MDTRWPDATRLVWPQRRRLPSVLPTPTGTVDKHQSARCIDLKVNGYCIVPPKHPSRNRLPYRWDEHPVASLPYRLRELLRPQPKPVRTFRGGSSKKALAGLIRTVAEARDRKRNTILYWASYRAIERKPLIKSKMN